MQDGLRLSKDEITRLKDTNSKNLFEEKKLVLLLDIDHTLLHATSIQHLTSAEKDEYLEEQFGSSKDVSNGSFFMLGPEVIANLRPFLFTFLKEVSTMFEMYIYTMSNIYYATQVAKLLDPKGDYFGNRLISRDDLIQESKKTLDLVLGREGGETRKNVLLMKGYHYFARNSEKKSCSEKKDNANESNSTLAYILAVLRAIHSLFFSPMASRLPCRDVRKLMQRFRSKLLMGCVIFLSDVDQFQIPYSDIKLKAKELGAEISETLDSSSVTHVVMWSQSRMFGLRNQDCVWAVMENKYLVNPQWIYMTYCLWHRQPEDQFFVLN